MAMTSTERSRKRREANKAKPTDTARICTDVSIAAKVILDAFTLAGATQRAVLEGLLFDAQAVAQATGLTKCIADTVVQATKTTGHAVACATVIVENINGDIVACATKEEGDALFKQSLVLGYFAKYGGYEGIKRDKKQLEIVKEVFDGDCKFATTEIRQFSAFTTRVVKECEWNTVE